MKKAFKIITTIVFICLAGIILLTFLSLLGIPKNLQIFVVETGSMSPKIPTGSLVFISPEQDYKVGDVISFNSKVEPNGTKNYVVTHRINAIKNDNGDTFYVTKGDANEDIDPLLANKLDVLGKVSFSVPYIGYAVGFAKTQMGFVLLVLVPSIVIIYSEILNISKEFKENEKRKKLKGLHLNFNV